MSIFMSFNLSMTNLLQLQVAHQHPGPQVLLWHPKVEKTEDQLIIQVKNAQYIVLSHSSQNSDAILDLFISHWQEKHSFIDINNCSSSTAPLFQGVPQGSVLAPLIFILYFLPLGQIIRRHGLRFQCYADNIPALLTQSPWQQKTSNCSSKLHPSLRTWLKNLLQQFVWDDLKQTLSQTHQVCNPSFSCSSEFICMTT